MKYFIASLMLVVIIISNTKCIPNNQDPYIITDSIVLAAVRKLSLSITPTCFNTPPNHVSVTPKKVLLPKTEPICSERIFELRCTKPLVYEIFVRGGNIQYLRRIMSVQGRTCQNEGSVCKSCSFQNKCKTFNQEAKKIVILNQTSAGGYFPVSKFYLKKVGKSCTCVINV